MGHFILGRKGRMIQVFNEAGQAVPVTIVEAGPCTVTQVKSAKGPDGYNAIQLALDPVKEKSISKPELGHFKKNGVAAHRVIREWRLETEPSQKAGEVISCTVFKAGDLVDAIGWLKGRGTAGVMKRHGFGGRPASHGHMCHRRPGSIGMHSDPGRVFKGKKMAGHYGTTRQTTKNLEIVVVDEENNLLLVKGAIPGPTGGLVCVQTAKTGVKKVKKAQGLDLKKKNPQKASAAKGKK